MKVADGFRRVANEYRVSTADSVKRHFLLQFINADLRQSLRELAPATGYGIQIPNMARVWPKFPWFAVYPRRRTTRNEINPTTVFVLDPEERSAYVAGVLVAPENLSADVVYSQTQEFEPVATGRARNAIFGSRSFRSSDRVLYRTHGLDGLQDESLAQDMASIRKLQANFASAFKFAPQDVLTTTAKSGSGERGTRLSLVQGSLEEPTKERRSLRSERPRRLYPVWYCTSRKEVAPFHAPWYSSDRVERGAINYGVCTVAIPKAHRFAGKRGSFWSWLANIFDDGFRIDSIEKFAEADFWMRARDGLDRMGANEKDALVYVHGFNTSFIDSVLRAAQIGYDLKFPGITCAFSWPSQGQLDPSAYAADGSTISGHCSYLAQFIAGLASQAEVRKIHIIAHSMGSLAILRGCIGRGVFTKEQSRRLGQIIFAAPDVDHDEFVKRAPEAPGARTTLYASNKDALLKISSGWNRFKRAGLLPPPTVVPGVDTVDVGAIDLSRFGHGYVAEAEAVLYDIFELVRRNTPPQQRVGIEAIDAVAGKYWKFV